MRATFSERTVDMRARVKAAEAATAAQRREVQSLEARLKAQLSVVLQDAATPAGVDAYNEVTDNSGDVGEGAAEPSAPGTETTRGGEGSAARQAVARLKADNAVLSADAQALRAELAAAQQAAGAAAQVWHTRAAKAASSHADALAARDTVADALKQEVQDASTAEAAAVQQAAELRRRAERVCVCVLRVCVCACVRVCVCAFV